MKSKIKIMLTEFDGDWNFLNPHLSFNLIITHQSYQDLINQLRKIIMNDYIFDHVVDMEPDVDLTEDNYDRLNDHSKLIAVFKHKSPSTGPIGSLIRSMHKRILFLEDHFK